jgi:hypothetical protein
VTAAATAILVAAGPASAHHGFTGEYDASKPLYVHGTVESATYGYPHGLIHISPGRSSTAPADLAELTAQEQQNLGGLSVVTGAAPVRARGEGRLTLLLPPPMTTEVADRSDRPEAGAEVGAVIFRECTTGELRVQLLRISEQQHVVRSGVMQTEVDGCAGGGSGAADGPSSRSATPSPDRTSSREAVTVAADEDQGGVARPLVIAAGLVAAAGTGAALVVAARAGGRTRRTPS